jgi:serine protease Do
VDRNGYIITNNHVVEGADRIRVRLFNGDDDPYDAKLIGRDPETDLAVIKINPKKRLSAAPMGNSNAVHVGDWAIAIGSPLGYPETVTVGIISAKSRDVRGAPNRPFQKFIQTDAAINPGNSGGPLLNMRGEVIGINTAIATHTGGYQGLGFALASNIAVDVYNQIIQRGRVARGSIGIEFQSIQKPALLRSFGAENGGVLVKDVIKGGPAEEAGMKSEDVIVEIDGKPIRDGDTLIAVVAATPVEATVPVVVIRGDKRKTLQVKIADREEVIGDELGYRRGQPREEEESAEVLFGITVQNLSSSDRQQLGYEGSDGVLVTEVEPGSFADDIGVLPNDIIVSINRRPVGSTSDISELQEGLKPGDDVAVKVMRRTPGRGEPSWEAHYLADVLPKSSEERF